MQTKQTSAQIARQRLHLIIHEDRVKLDGGLALIGASMIVGAVRRIAPRTKR